MIFRIWDKIEGKFYEPVFEAHKGRVHELLITTDGLLNERTNDGLFKGESCFPNRYVIQMFIGLKDKHGTPIFEGDIIFVDGWDDYKNCKPLPKKEELQGTFLIESTIGHWGIETDWKHLRGYECTTHIMGDTEGNAANLEIIGNQFEHPELL